MSVEMRLRFGAMRRFVWLSLPALFVACSSVPDVVFEDERAGDAAAEGTSSGSSRDAAASSGSSGLPPGESALCRERKKPGEKCCGDTPCWGNQCPQGCAWCAESCNAKDKKCCLNRGEQKCINLDEDCAEELDL